VFWLCFKMPTSFGIWLCVVSGWRSKMNRWETSTRPCSPAAELDVTSYSAQLHFACIVDWLCFNCVVHVCTIIWISEWFVTIQYNVGEVGISVNLNWVEFIVHVCIYWFCVRFWLFIIITVQGNRLCHTRMERPVAKVSLQGIVTYVINSSNLTSSKAFSNINPFCQSHWQQFTEEYTSAIRLCWFLRATAAPAGTAESAY